MKRTIVALILACLYAVNADAQIRMTLNDVVQIARERSYAAQIARFNFLTSYWTYRSYKAELLPSMSLSGSLLNYDRSIVEARNSEDGKINYVENNSLSNYLTLSLDQRIVATGGTVSLQSYLYRLDQFDYDLTTYNTQPIRISYTQPLRAYNELKWEKRIEPKKYLIAEKTYMETLEGITLNATSLFFAVLDAQSSYKQSLKSYEDRTALYEMAKKRFELGTLNKSDILQMELSLLNEQVAVNENKLTLDDKLFSLFSYLRIKDYEGIELVPPYSTPELLVDADFVLQKAKENSSFVHEQELSLLESEENLAKIKSQKGLQIQLNSEIGFTQSADKFKDAYSRLKDNEIIGLTVTLPIFDWGMSRGRVNMAEAQLEIARTEAEQSEIELIQSVNQKVKLFNSQQLQCKNALRAQDISAERYEISKRLFSAGSISVTELNTAQQEMESANTQYLRQLQTFWTSYYELQKLTLYDWIMKRDIEVDVNKIISR